jgi:hypothetical protein
MSILFTEYIYTTESTESIEQTPQALPSHVWQKLAE